MRLWSLHPAYLDAKGLLALWREGLLAQKVLQGKTRGYRHHPQLERFQDQADPAAAITAYLQAVLAEAECRGYHFDRDKIGPARRCGPLTVSAGQLRYELEHLRAKLKGRDPAAWARLEGLTEPRPHPLFRVLPGPVEAWERAETSTAARKKGTVR